MLKEKKYPNEIQTLELDTWEAKIIPSDLRLHIPLHSIYCSSYTSFCLLPSAFFAIRAFLLYMKLWEYLRQILPSLSHNASKPKQKRLVCDPLNWFCSDLVNWIQDASDNYPLTLQMTKIHILITELMNCHNLSLWVSKLLMNSFHCLPFPWGNEDQRHFVSYLNYKD